jgi:multidrug resistance protein MdtO
MTMEAVAQPVTGLHHPLEWFREFLKQELAPYPGRAALVARMVISATLVMIISMTFELPFAFQSCIFTFIISRESTRATMKAVTTAVSAFGLAALYVILGAIIWAGQPFPRLLWIIGTLFLAFFLIATISDYVAGIGFGILISISLPLWDSHIPTELKVERTLWALGQTGMACGMTLLVELAFAGLQAADEPVRSLTRRLASIEELLASYATSGSVDESVKKELTQFSMVGTSRLRRFLRRSTHSLHFREQMGTLIALVGRLVDLAANLAALKPQAPDNERQRMHALAENIAGIRADLLSEKTPGPIQLSSQGETASIVPLLSEMERIVWSIPEAFTGPQLLRAYSQVPPGDPPRRFFVPDAFSNPDHIKFGLKGGLAAALCYIIYNALAWPGISTAVVTCVLTALTTIGASRQKQVLRISGAAVGGFIFGMGAQIFILPHVDSIGGFTVLFITVSVIAAWFATSSTRLSYFGVQLALAFYIVNLQEFTIETGLTFARDRVVGVLLGLFMMWLVFDQLWGASAAVEMKRTFVSLLRCLAELTRWPAAGDAQPDVERGFALREIINNGFDKVRAFADGVLFEFGPSRQADLALRTRIIRWHPQLRMLYITRVGLCKYRLGLPGFQLPQSIRLAQQEFDKCLAAKLEGMADRLERKAPAETKDLAALLVHLEESMTSVRSEQEPGIASARTFLVLSRRIKGLVASLEKEI